MFGLSTLISCSDFHRQKQPLIDVRFDKAASDWITLQEENSSCKFGALQGIKVVRAGSYHTRPENQANDFEKVYMHGFSSIYTAFIKTFSVLRIVFSEP